VQPDVKDVNGRHTLRLPPPAPLRTANSLRYSGELGARFGYYLPSKGQGRTYVWAEVNPHLIERGKLKDPEDRAFIKDRCTHILRQDGLIRETSNGFVDTHGCPWAFPEHRGDSTANGEQLHMLECQVWHACDKPYMATLVTSSYNVPVIQWFVISLLQVLYEMNIVCSCLGPLSHNQAFYSLNYSGIYLMPSPKHSSTCVSALKFHDSDLSIELHLETLLLEVTLYI
jgi:hypothetical protein